MQELKKNERLFNLWNDRKRRRQSNIGCSKSLERFVPNPIDAIREALYIDFQENFNFLKFLNKSHKGEYMKRHMKLFFAAISFVFSANAFGEIIDFGDISYAGTGCPSGSITTPDMELNSEIIFSLDHFLVETGFTNDRRIDRKSCSLAIPFNARGDFSIALVAAPEGFVDLFDDSTVKVQQEIFFAGTRGPVLSKKFEGPLMESFSADDFGFPEDIAWSPCGSSGTLRVNLNALASGVSFGAIEHLRMKILVRSCY